MDHWPTPSHAFHKKVGLTITKNRIYTRRQLEPVPETVMEKAYTMGEGAHLWHMWWQKDIFFCYDRAAAFHTGLNNLFLLDLAQSMPVNLLSFTS